MTGTHADLPLASLLDVVKPSATAEFFQRVNRMRREGTEVLGFGVGEPDFDTPPHIVEATVRALRSGATRYTPVRGLDMLREAICEDSLRIRAGLSHTPEQVVVSVGAKQSLFHVCLATLGASDEAIVPAPCWVSYPDQCRLAGARPVIIDTSADAGFKLQPEQLRAAVTPRTRALFLCSPCNPTGAAYSESELRALAEVIREGQYWLVLDEIYGQLTYGDFQQRSLLQVAPDLRDRAVIVDGVSKRFAMTGFRIGWALAPARLCRALETLQGQNTTGATTVAQHAALAALRGDQACVAAMRATFARRRQLVLDRVSGMEGLRCLPPDGAFYVFLDGRARIGPSRGDTAREGARFADDVALADHLLEEARCALVPGSAFLAPGYLRMSYAASDAEINEGLTRISEVLDRR